MAGKSGRQQQPNQKNQPALDAAPAVAPFLLKTHQMVEDPETDKVISWTPTGASFVVWNIDELARTILPQHFKHNNFSSFVRQLNTYGFRKVASERWEFTNDHFLRGEPDLLTKIVRRKPFTTTKSQTQPTATDGGQSPPVSTSKDEDQSSSSTTSLTPMPQQDQYIPNYQQQVLLLQDNEKLKKENQILSAQLDDARKLCHMYQGIFGRYLNVQLKLDTNSTQVVSNTNTGVDKVEETHEEEVEKCGASTQFKLFGVCLKEFAQGKQEITNNNNNKRKRFCNQDIDSIIKRPPKMAGFWAL